MINAYPRHFIITCTAVKFVHNNHQHYPKFLRTKKHSVILVFLDLMRLQLTWCYVKFKL